MSKQPSLPSLIALPAEVRECRNGLEMVEGAVAFYLDLAGTHGRPVSDPAPPFPYEMAETNPVCRSCLESIYTCLLDIFEEGRGQQDGSVKRLCRATRHGHVCHGGRHCPAEHLPGLRCRHPLRQPDGCLPPAADGKAGRPTMANACQPFAQILPRPTVALSGMAARLSHPAFQGGSVCRIDRRAGAGSPIHGLCPVGRPAGLLRPVRGISAAGGGRPVRLQPPTGHRPRRRGFPDDRRGPATPGRRPAARPISVMR
jgi:hypothetical protein